MKRRRTLLASVEQFELWSRAAGAIDRVRPGRYKGDRSWANWARRTLDHAAREALREREAHK